MKKITKVKNRRKTKRNIKRNIKRNTKRNKSRTKGGVKLSNSFIIEIDSDNIRTACGRRSRCSCSARCY
jgi:hypothetical protein